MIDFSAAICVSWVRIQTKHRCIRDFVNNLWREHLVSKSRHPFAGSNPNTELWKIGSGLYKLVSWVRIQPQTEKPRNASTKFQKTSESKKTEKSLDISVFLLFSWLHFFDHSSWLGWPDSDRRMPESKSGALPLGYTPMFDSPVHYTIFRCVCQGVRTFFVWFLKFMHGGLRLVLYFEQTADHRYGKYAEVLQRPTVSMHYKGNTAQFKKASR